jgi:hypothetical protein
MQEIVQSTYSTFYPFFLVFQQTPILPQHPHNNLHKHFLRTQYMDKSCKH